MNEEQKLRLDLLVACGYNVDAANKCLDFVLDEENMREQRKTKLPDGVYLINKYEEIAPYDGKEKIGIEPITHIGIVQGDRSLAIALQDVNKEPITLTKKKGNKDHGGYIDEHLDALQDWQGKKNTEHLQATWLNPAIQMKDGEYIPTLAELNLIYLNKKAINEAMRFVGGQELDFYYWSSTEHSATRAWCLNFSSGIMISEYKARSYNHVRPVKKFL